MISIGLPCTKSGNFAAEVEAPESKKVAQNIPVQDMVARAGNRRVRAPLVRFPPK
jgi:hypothetical protein